MLSLNVFLGTRHTISVHDGFLTIYEEGVGSSITFFSTPEHILVLEKAFRANPIFATATPAPESAPPPLSESIAAAEPAQVSAGDNNNDEVIF